MPAALHLQHPVKASSSGRCSIGAVPNPVIRYDQGWLEPASFSPRAETLPGKAGAGRSTRVRLAPGGLPGIVIR